jgi:hypothetical protein
MDGVCKNCSSISALGIQLSLTIWNKSVILDFPWGDYARISKIKEMKKGYNFNPLDAFCHSPVRPLEASHLKSGSG